MPQELLKAAANYGKVHVHRQLLLVVLRADKVVNMLPDKMVGRM